MDLEKMKKTVKERLTEDEIQEYKKQIDSAEDLFNETINLNRMRPSISLAAIGRVYLNLMNMCNFTSKQAKECLMALSEIYQKEVDGK